MNRKILVTYATWTGATREVAEAVAETLRDENLVVDVVRARASLDVEGYQAVLLGTSVHMGRLPRDVIRFARRNRKKLEGGPPVALFLVCLTMAEDTPQNRETATGYLEPLQKALGSVEPVEVGLFAGAILTEGEDYKRLSPLLKLPVNSIVAEHGADRRDWEAIRSWAAELKDKLL